MTWEYGWPELEDPGHRVYKANAAPSVYSYRMTKFTIAC